MTRKNKLGQKGRGKQGAGGKTTFSLSLSHTQRKQFVLQKRQSSGPKGRIIWGKYHSEWKQIEDLAVPQFFTLVSCEWDVRCMYINRRKAWTIFSPHFFNPYEHSDHLGGTYIFLVLSSTVGKQKALSSASQWNRSVFNIGNPLGTGRGKSLISSCKQERLSTRHSGDGNAFGAFST